MSWIKRVLGTKRYFIVFYNAKTSNGYAIAEEFFITSGGNYLNLKLARNQITKQHTTLKSVVFTGIIELCKADYEVCTSKNQNNSQVH